MKYLDRIKIILVRTSHPGNIGASARAMKTMGFSALHLVAPDYFPHPKAQEMASGADDLLHSAIVHGDLASAIADCHWVIGTSTRVRSIPWSILTPPEMAVRCHAMPDDAKIGLVFGCEKSGLNNEELELCQAIVNIPTSEEYGALNLAAAVQVLCYELRMNLIEKNKAINSSVKTHSLSLQQDDKNVFAPAEEIEKFFSHLKNIMIKIHFLKPQAPRRLMTRMRRLFLRAHLETMEVNMLRGFLSAIEKTIERDFQND